MTYENMTKEELEKRFVGTHSICKDTELDGYLTIEYAIVTGIMMTEDGEPMVIFDSVDFRMDPCKETATYHNFSMEDGREWSTPLCVYLNEYEEVDEETWKRRIAESLAEISEKVSDRYLKG